MRLLFIGVLLGIILISKGAYSIFLQAGTSSEPTTISITDLQKALPSNRNLIITGGDPIFPEQIHYFKTRHGNKEEGSDLYFLPIRDPATPGRPPVLLQITLEGMERFKQNFDPAAIHGIRLTHYDFESRVTGFLNQRYGNGAASQMILLEYEKEVTGIRPGLVQVLAGAALGIGCLLFPVLLRRRQSRPT